MSITSIVSYDGTATDRDALSLGRTFAELGATTVLAYVSHNPKLNQGQELLDRGAAELKGASTRLVSDPSTSKGLKSLVEAEHADLIVFGSDYRTPRGRVSFQKTAGQLLDGGNAALAIAPADYTPRKIQTIGLIAELTDHAAIDTAHALAQHHGATVTDKVTGVDLLVFGSRAEATPGRVLLSSRNEITIEEEASAPVLVVARDTALNFSPEPELYVA
ncbi:MAG: hypothetical protein J2O48_12005 [Solirubrobacterales bacterium]|nr:hypothetical protein [Solirubrobacterales bacterium]